MGTITTTLIGLTQSGTAAGQYVDPLIRTVTDCLKEFGFDGHLAVIKTGQRGVSLTGSFHPDMMSDFRNATRKLADQGIDVNAPYLIREETVTVGTQES